MNKVVLKIFATRMEAEIAKGYLAEHGIEALISADDMSGVQPQLALTQGVQLLVPARFAQEAKELLEETDKQTS